MDPVLRLLIVEDSEADFDLACWTLSRSGMKVDARRVDRLGDLSAALEEGVDWDAVLSDYSLPGLSIQEVAGTVRRCGKALPVILLAGSLQEGVAATMGPLGIRHVVSKDRPEDLRKAVQEALQGQG